MNNIEVLNEYYINLDYNNEEKKEKAIEHVLYLSNTVRFHNTVDICARLETLGNIIRENISYFKLLCRHVDEIQTILDYLFEYFLKIEKLNYHARNLTIEMLYTLLAIENEPIRSFLLFPITLDSEVEDFAQKELKLVDIFTFEIEMIIFDDADLNAIINYLIIKRKFVIRTLWMHKLIHDKFLWLMKRHGLCISEFYLFQMLNDISLKKLGISHTTVTVLSIWTENIILANKFTSKNRHLTFVNLYMDFSGGVITLPHYSLELYISSQIVLYDIQENLVKDQNIEDNVNAVHISHIAETTPPTSIHYLFYNGALQAPVQGLYWKHNDNFWPNTTNEDIRKCITSAKNAYVDWNCKTFSERTQILSKLESVLEICGKPLLAAIVKKWTKFKYFYSFTQGCVNKNGTEFINSPKSIGIIILKEKNENVLFFRLLQTILAGNSVIIIFDANCCNLEPYWTLFSREISTGLVNFLSHENINILETKLCSSDYNTYANTYFEKNNSWDTYAREFENLSMVQYTIIPNNFQI